MCGNLQRKEGKFEEEIGDKVYSVASPPPIGQLKQLKRIQFVEDSELVTCKDPR